MKSKIVLLILSVLLFSSCIVKSLQPFYTKDKLVSNDKLIGDWKDQKGGEWNIISIKSEFKTSLKDSLGTITYDLDVTVEDKAIYENYKTGYLITHTKDSKEAKFIAMPFKINNQYFVDFIPFDIYDGIQNINDLASEHLLKTHSVAKLDVDSNNMLSFSWISEERIEFLFKSSKLRLKHENIGIEETLLLTASSDELSNFLKKYLKSDLKDKWKKSDQLILTKSDAKP